MRNLLMTAMLLVPATSASATTFVYVSEAGEGAIKIFRADETTGALTAVDSLKVAGTPGSLGTDPAKRFLFASLRSTVSIASHQIEAATGKLTPINSTTLTPGANAAFVTTDRQGKFLLSASYNGARVTVHAIDASGRLGSEPLQTIETAKTAHSFAITDDNRLAFVPHVAPNAVYQFRFDGATGKLESLGQAPGGAEKAGPRHIAIHPSQKFAFTSDETGSSITSYALDSRTGLKPMETLSTLPTDFSARNTTADVKMHPSGKFVWVSNRGHDSLAGFAFDAASGKLKAIGQTPTEKTPRSFDVAPSGRFIYSAGEGSGKLAAYRVNESTGQLERFATYDVGKSLTWVMVVVK